MSQLRDSSPITPDLLLRAYSMGLFPMAERRESRSVFWVSPKERGIVPLDRFHVPRRLARTVKSDRYEVSVDRDFGTVIRACAEAAPGREQTWINAEIEDVYTTLHRMGHAHSVECRRDGELLGGL
ncbi:MAG TPA: leucyl/phenylalanyl-tRNA--protein transferase, partial [Rhizomicrobium sp.]